MKRKELKTLAKKIAEAEKKYQSTIDTKEKALLEKEIMHLTGQVHSIQDMETLDIMIQDLISD